MSSTRDQILSKLRTARQPFTQVAPILPEDRQRVVIMQDTSPAALQTRFIQEAQALGCKLYCVNRQAAQDIIRKLIADDTQVLSWSQAYIPLAGLHEALQAEGIMVAAPADGDVRGGERVGITGVDAALAATGSLVLMTGEGKPRSASLLPDVHLAVLTPDQIIADMEAWVEAQRQDGFKTLTASSNTVIISGPSKTADIAQELIKGAHGPREVHIILLIDPSD